MPSDRLGSWLWAALVTLLAGVLRFDRLGWPPEKIFDEIYYAKDSHDLLLRGVELNSTDSGPGFVVHPPMGKWLIAAGEQLFGYNSVGWRVSAAVVGSLAVLVLFRVARRMTRSTLLGGVAGLLLALDGLEFVQSRVAMLDIFVMFWLLAGFACLVVDRDRYRARLAGLDRYRWRWWRWASAVCLGLATATKWTGLFYLVAFGLLAFAWDSGARRAAGVPRPVRTTLRDSGSLVGTGLLAVATYLATWTGWFLSPMGWDRNWAAQTGHHVPFVPDALVGLWQYHVEMYHFHVTLTASHPYASQPWSWLFLARPVAYYYSDKVPCGAPSCAAEVLAIGTPPLWWGFLPVLVTVTWLWVTRRDWRAAAVLTGVGACFLPLLPYPHRTMFLFYALPALPFLVLGTTLTLGLVMGERGASPQRRLVGVLLAGGYVLLVALAFFYFYPVLSGSAVPYGIWRQRMWFGSWI